MKTMSKKILIGLFFVLALFFVSNANAQSVSGSIANGTIKRGGSARGMVVLNIPGGLHTNSNRPAGENLIPTRVTVSGSGVKLSAVSYPRGKNKKFSFQDPTDKPLNVYEGRVAFNFNVTVPASYKGNTVRIRAVVRYQACNDEVCFAPKNQEVTLTANVR
jgi:DsbC/DsbD-like thiol-disulfide interchange protein